ncbi:MULTISPECIES: nitrate reductase [Agrobacterium]|jgi:assimilatory nitrate reductase catalytic subunit|uniref:Molybdopterin-dependent oxidoreductase n=3 Tax=Bacteria TaxID=2 RepID=U4QEE2_9HYPH|nr:MULTISPECIES: nitrate reductase [Agrobacterium]MBB2908601.1 assimilatory nitrate reductase catalytic subunit [Rhizobium sp. RAS22]OAI92016.1 nitrate reductase [Rhizobium sp. GHKF11]MDR6191540.1 assimilatory nitrate reductase catalytic subunit [Agrobacterium pusense]NRF09697.1 molybdopterin-dependent oxidoreductase [Agrobacterium pusense]NRF19398.1 molybdopterin-dependent oxidoreductase [Agrobacterium pusense]
MPVETKTTCPYCGVGCGVIATVNDDGIVSIRGDQDHPANFGRLCSKGSALAETIDLEGRILHPEINGKRATWDEALDLVASRFSDTIAEHGPDSVAFYVSGQLLTEDYYLANKLMKGFIGSANIDTNSRLCMSSSVAGHRRAFGADTVPGTYEDMELADLVILTGSNLAWCHPVLYQRLAAAKAARPEMKVVVIDPRRTMSADIADMHLAIRPDGDVALFTGLLAHLSGSPAVDHAFVEDHTVGFDAAMQAATEHSLPDIAEATGLTIAELIPFYELFERTEKTVTCYSQGVNQSQSGTDKVNAIINCHLATGRIGRPGMGPFSLTGQPNAMGGREVGGLANMLAAHMAIESAGDRDRVQRFWASPAIAEKPGLKAVDMFRAVADGRIKALWIMATNPVVSMPDAGAVEAAIKACPFVVVSDVMAKTDTARHAHVLLPSLGWGEKDGTVTNSERRISRQRGFLDTPGEAKADWWQMAEVGRRMGFGAAFAFRHASEIFAEHAALSGFENLGSRDFDISGVDPKVYDGMAPLQWPRPQAGDAGTTRFFEDGRFYHADGKARFIVTALPEVDRTSADYPLTLNTGRIRDQWHTMTRTGKSARLTAHIAEPFAELHPRDAQALGIESADLVELESPHGKVLLRALISERQARGSVFAPMHWNDQFASLARIDMVVAPVTDPYSGQPASKNTGVRARRFEAKAYGFAISRTRPDAPDCAYWAIAKADGGYRMELAFAEEPQDWMLWARQVFGIDAGIEPLGYSDRQTGDLRLAFFDGDILLAALFIARRPVAVARNWAILQLTERHEDLRMRFALIAGRPGAGRPDPGATVCSCFNVGVNQITAAVRDGCHSVEAIGKVLNAGTNCGSCRAEIKGVINGCLKTAAE